MELKYQVGVISLLKIPNLMWGINILIKPQEASLMSFKILIFIVSRFDTK